MLILKKRTLVVVLSVATVLVGCRSSFVIQTETISESKLNTYNSFKFFNPENIPKSNFAFSDENKKIIFDAVASEFKKRDYQSLQQADLVVKVQGGTQTERESRNNQFVGPMYPGGGFYGQPYRYGNFYEDISRKKTTIIIDVLEAGTNKLLWQGVATGEMGKKPEDVEPKLQEAINKIFEKFPGQ